MKMLARTRHGLIWMVLPTSVLVGGAALAFADIGSGVFVGEEAYPAGSCIGGLWNLWTLFIAGKKHQICCSPETRPTGNVDPRFATCRRPGDERGDCTVLGSERTVCAVSLPFEICCRPGTIATCDPDVRNRQCVVNPIDELIDQQFDLAATDGGGK